MDTALVYAVAGTALFTIGLYALAVRAHLLRKILALNVMGSGTFLVLAALASRGVPDPVPQAMVITGIVVAVAATALALVLMLKLAQASGRATLPDPTRDAPR